MNSWIPTDFTSFLKMGWPLFWFVMTTMAIVYIWRMKDKSTVYKIIWSIVVLAIPFLGIGIWLVLAYR